MPEDDREVRGFDAGEQDPDVRVRVPGREGHGYPENARNVRSTTRYSVTAPATPIMKNRA
jgi:hypothetical protein